MIDKSEGVTQTDSRPFELTVRLAPIIKFMADADTSNPVLSSIAGSLKESGKDRIQLTAEPIRNGYLYRLEAEEGILKVIGLAAKLAAAQGGLGAF